MENLASWLQQVEEDMGLPMSACQFATLDHSLWRLLWPSAMQVQQWVSECGYLAITRLSCVKIALNTATMHHPTWLIDACVCLVTVEWIIQWSMCRGTTQLPTVHGPVNDCRLKPSGKWLVGRARNKGWSTVHWTPSSGYRWSKVLDISKVSKKTYEVRL